MKNYYNTNKETGNELKKSRADAESLQKMIYALFLKNGNKPLHLAPHEVYRILPSYRPLSSYRRAMTNLTREKKLVKTDKMVMGTYGKQVHTWRLA